MKVMFEVAWQDFLEIVMRNHFLHYLSVIE